MVKEDRHLRVHLVDRPLLLLVRLQNLKELLVRVRVAAKPLLDLVHVVDRMVELDGLAWRRLGRAPHRLIAHRRCTTVWTSRRRRRGRWRRRRTHRRQGHAHGARRRGRTHGWTARRTLSKVRRRWRVRTCHRRARRRIVNRRRASDARGHLWLDTAHCTSHTDTTQRLRRRARGRSYRDKVAFIFIDAALNAVARRKERVEALDQARLAAEKRRHPLNHARRVDRLTLKLRQKELLHTHVFHNIQKAVVYVRMISELDLDLVQVRQRIAHVERSLFRQLQLFTEHTIATSPTTWAERARKVVVWQGRATSPPRRLWSASVYCLCYARPHARST